MSDIWDGLLFYIYFWMQTNVLCFCSLTPVAFIQICDLSPKRSKGLHRQKRNADPKAVSFKNTKTLLGWPFAKVRWCKTDTDWRRCLF